MTRFAAALAVALAPGLLVHPAFSAPLSEILPKLPARDTGRFGKAGDPLNLVFLGNAEEVERALSEPGWTRIPVGIAHALLAAAGELLHGRAPRVFPPMNLYRLEGRLQDYNWAKPITTIAKRHHFRLWRSGWKDERGRDVWWGSGNLDVAVRWDLSHVPDPDMVAERGAIAASLAGSRRVESAELLEAPQVPLAGVNDKGYPFRTDGRVLVIALKKRRK